MCLLRLTVAAGQDLEEPSNSNRQLCTQFLWHYAESLLCRWVLANQACQVAIKLRDLAQAIIKRRASQLLRGLAATASGAAAMPSGAAALAAALALGPQQLLDMPQDLRVEAQVKLSAVRLTTLVPCILIIVDHHQYCTARCGWQDRLHAQLLFLLCATMCLHSSSVDVDEAPSAS